MNMVYRWPNATYAVINPKDAYIPKEIAQKSIAIKEDIAVTLKKLLGKPSDHIVSDTSFEPGTLYSTGDSRKERGYCWRYCPVAQRIEYKWIDKDITEQ